MSAEVSNIVDDRHHYILLGILLLTGVVSAKFSNRFNLPSLVLFIAVGMIMNRFIYFDNTKLTQLFGIMALIVILFEGGMQTRWKQMRPVVGAAVSLATFGVVVTALVFGLCAAYILDISWKEGLLIGAIVGSTDAAAVFAVMGSQRVRRKLSSTLRRNRVRTIRWRCSSLCHSLNGFKCRMRICFLCSCRSCGKWGSDLYSGLGVGWLAIQIVNRIHLTPPDCIRYCRSDLPS